MGYIAVMTNAASRGRQPRQLALFDLDGTLSWRDTLAGFLGGYIGRFPLRAIRLWRLPSALTRYVFDRDRGMLKSRVIRMVMGGDSRTAVDAWADGFVARLHDRGVFRSQGLAVLEAHRAAGDCLVLLSASPDLYVPRIGRLLGFERTLCTGIQWRGEPPHEVLDGSLLTPNRRGEEKSRCLMQLRELYPGLPVIAYGNSASDLPHMRLAEQALLVNADAGARRQAAALGIPAADWT